MSISACVFTVWIAVNELHCHIHLRVSCLYLITNILLLQFLTAAPSMPPEDLIVEATTSESISLSWSPPDVQSQNGIITGYLINVTAIETGETFQVSSATTNLVIQSLRPFTMYICVIAAETSAGTGPFSISLSVQTSESGTLHCLRQSKLPPKHPGCCKALSE